MCTRYNKGQSSHSLDVRKTETVYPLHYKLLKGQYYIWVHLVSSVSHAAHHSLMMFNDNDS